MRKILLLCGVLSPLLYAVADVVAGLKWSGYSFRDQAISELGAVGAPTRQIFAILLVVVYLLLIAFGAGVWQSAAGNRKVKTIGGLLIGLGVLAITIGQFVPMQLRGTKQGLSGALHLIEGAVAMTMVIVTMAVAAASFGTRFRVYTIANIACVLAFGAWSSMDISLIKEGLPTPWAGVKERVFWYACQAWFAVLAITLLRRRAAKHGRVQVESGFREPGE